MMSLTLTVILISLIISFLVGVLFFFEESLRERLIRGKIEGGLTLTTLLSWMVLMVLIMARKAEIVVEAAALDRLLSNDALLLLLLATSLTSFWIRLRMLLRLLGNDSNPLEQHELMESLSMRKSLSIRGLRSIENCFLEDDLMMINEAKEKGFYIRLQRVKK